MANALTNNNKISNSGKILMTKYKPTKVVKQVPVSEKKDEDYNKGGLLGGIGYTLGNLGIGAFSVLEGIWDYSAGGVAKLFGADEWAEEQFANNVSGDLSKGLDKMYNPSGSWEFAGDIASGVGNSLVGLGAAAGATILSGGALTVSAGIIAGTTAGLGAAGNATTAAYEKTGKLGAKEFAFGALSGGTEGVLEGLTGSAGKVGAKLFAKKTAKTLAKSSVAKGLVSNFAGEAFEEGMSEFLTPYFERWTDVDPNAKNATWQQIGYASLVGGISGSLLGGIGDAYSNVKAINRGNNISKDAQKTEAVLGMARSYAQYEAEHNTGKEAYQYITSLVNQFDALDKGDGNLTMSQKKLLGQMEVADVVLSVEPEIERSKEKIRANAAQFVEAVNAKGLADANGNAIKINSADDLLNNDVLLTQFATADALGQLFMSKDSVYDLVVNKGKTDGIMQEDFRIFQKEASAKEKASINQLFGIDVDSTTYHDFINKIQTTNRKVVEEKQDAINAIKSAKAAIARAINTNADIPVLDINSVFAEGTNVFKTKSGKYIVISKQGDQYYLYAEDNISKPLTKSKLKSAIKALNGEQTQSKPKKKKPTTTQATATTQGTQTTAPDVTPQVAPSSDTTPTPTTETGVNKPQTETPSNQSTETRTGEETAENKPKATNSTEDTTTTKPKATTTEEPSTIKPKAEDTTAQTDENTQKPKAPAKPEAPKSTKAPNKATARRGVVRLVMSKENRESLRGAGVKDGKQYVSNGAFAARYNDILDGVTEASAESYPFDVFDRVIDQNSNATAEERVEINSDEIRKLVPTKRVNYIENAMRIDKNYYQLSCFSKLLDSISNPQVFLKKKGKSNPVYIKGDNGEVVLLPLKFESGQVNPIYEADYAVKEIEQATSEKKTGTAKRKKRSVTRTNDKEGVGVVTGTGVDTDVRFALSKGKAEKLKDDLVKIGTLGIRLDAGGKSIRILTDKFTQNKNIFSNKGRTMREVNARIKAIPHFVEILKSCTYEGSDTEIHGLENEAKKGVVAMHRFKGSYDGFDIEVVVRDKGSKQFLYEIKFIEKEKSPQQSMTDESASPAPLGDAENKSIITHSEKKSNTSGENSSKRLQKAEEQYAMSEDTQLNTTPNGSKGQVLKPLEMKRAESVARNKIKGFDNLTAGEKLEVEWTLASAWRSGIDTTEALNLAKLSTAIGAGIGFADISTKTADGKTVAPDAVCCTRGGHLTIYLNPNGKRTVECATLHELAHSLEGTEGYAELQAMAEKYYAEHPAEKKAIDDTYKAVYKKEQVKYAEEILPSELTAHYVETMLAKRDILAKLTKENPTFTQKCIEKIKAIRKKLTKADAELSEVDLLETRFTSIFNLNKNRQALDKNNEVLYAFKRKRIASYINNRLSTSTLSYIRNELYKIYDGLESGIADGVAIESGDDIYIVDSGKENGKIDFGVKKRLRIIDDRLRQKRLEKINGDAIRNGHISRGLFGQFGSTPDNSSRGGVGGLLGKELSTDTTKSQNNQSGISTKNATGGGRGLKKYALNVADSADTRYALSPDDITGSELVMTDLPQDRVSFKDVITRKKDASDLTEQVKEDSKEFTEGWQIATTNAQAGLERVLRETGTKDAEAVTNYVRAGKNAAYGALTVGQFSLDGETYLGESWQKIWQPVYAMDKKDGQAYKMFNLYLFHWHNTDRYVVGKPVLGDNITDADSRDAIEKIEKEYPKFRKIAEKVWKFNDNNLQIAVDSGMYSQEYAETLREMYPHYVPTLRNKDDASVGAIQGKSNVRVNPNKKKAVGSDLEILPIDQTVAQQTIQRIAAARVNQMLLSIKNGKASSDFEVINAESKTADIDEETNIKLTDDKTKKTNQVTFWENGKSITAAISQNVYRGIESFMPSGDTSFNNVLINAVAKGNTVFKKLVTAWNPFFVLFKNPIRDIQTALNYTRYTWATYSKNLKRAANEISNNGRYWQEAQAAGILSSTVYDYRKGLQYKNKGKWARVTGKLESVSNAVEMTPRLAEYISARESGLSVQEALLQAQDLTTNFGRSGTLTKKANATFMPFLNPAVQGFSKMVRAYTGKDAARSWLNLIVRSVILGFGLTALNDILNEDDEEYQNLSDHVKSSNYVLGDGTGQFLKIPKGRENGFIGEIYLRAKRALRGDEDAWDGTINSFISNLTPTDNFTRTIFSPLVDMSTNTTWYGGAIEGQKWNDTSPKNRYDESTSKISIWLGKIFNYSPIKIDYMLEQYGGIVADIVIPATNLEAETGIVTQNMLANSTTNSRWSTEFYSELEKYTYKKTDGDKQAKGVVRYLNSINSKISKMYKQKREIQGDKDLSAKEKLTQVKIIQATINALQKDSLSNVKVLYDELGKYELTDDTFDDDYIFAAGSVIGEEFAFESYNKRAYEKAQKINSLGVDYATYFDYYFTINKIESEKDDEGNTISGSKKKSVVSYTLKQDIPTLQKLILILSAGYSIKDGDIKGISEKRAKKLVAEHIAKLNITVEEKIELAEMCGLNVKNGKIYLD